jgi:hypothetical protein
MNRLERRKATRRGPLGRPTYRSDPRARLKPIEVIPTARQVELLTGPENAYLRCYRLGECSVVVTRERGRWHLSIAHPGRLPTWEEVASARYALLPGDLVCGMVLPPREAYVNLHEHCFQVFEIRDPDPGFRPQT